MHDVLVRPADHGSGGQLAIAANSFCDCLLLGAGVKTFVDTFPEGLGEIDSLGEREGHQLLSERIV